MFGGLSVQTFVQRRICVPFRDLSSAASSRELFMLSAHQQTAREKLVKISNLAYIVFVFWDCFARLNGHFASLRIDWCFSRLLKITEHSFPHWIVTDFLEFSFLSALQPSFHPLPRVLAIQVISWNASYESFVWGFRILISNILCARAGSGVTCWYWCGKAAIVEYSNSG